MQATNSKHMSCHRERKRGRGRHLTYVEAINCLFIVCYLFAFLFIASRFVSSPTARAETTQHCVRPVTVTVTTLVTAQTGNNFISKIASFYAYYPWSLSSSHCFSHCQFQLHTASVSIVLISAANLPIVQSTIRLLLLSLPTQEAGTMGNSSLFAFWSKNNNRITSHCSQSTKGNHVRLFYLHCNFYSSRKTCQISKGISN